MSKRTSSMWYGLGKIVLGLQVVGVVWILFFVDHDSEESEAPAATSTDRKQNNSARNGKKLDTIDTDRIAQMIRAQRNNTKPANASTPSSDNARDNELAAVKLENQKLEQKLQEVNRSVQDLIDQGLLGSADQISADDQSFLQALDTIPGDAASTAKMPTPSTLASNAPKRVAKSTRSKPSNKDINAQIQALMKNNRKATNDPSASTNLVVVNLAPQDSKVTGKLTDIQARINQLLAKNDAPKAAREPSTKNTQYLESLVPLEKERSNETRWITVKAGDTLFIIAERAYGDGSLYPQIYEANPQVLTNPDIISPGQRLRVPLQFGAS